jgi:hypothetical protein
MKIPLKETRENEGMNRMKARSNIGRQNYK